MKEIKLIIDDKTPTITAECPHCKNKDSIEASAYTINDEDFFRHGVHYGHTCTSCNEDFCVITYEDELPPADAVIVGKRASFGISGIKCDRDGCTYADMSVKLEDYPEWLNKPCPVCGDPLLTQEHLDEVNTMIMTTQIMNEIDDDTLKQIGEMVGDLSPEQTQALISTLPQSMQDAFYKAGLIDLTLSEKAAKEASPNQVDSPSDSNAPSGGTDSGASVSTSDTGSTSVSSCDGGAGGF